MRLEYHQLDRRWEHLRVRHPARQRRLLASLVESGQQTPIVVVPAEGLADRYVVIDGYKRIAALEQLGRDTVEAVVWPMSEAAAVLLDRSLRLSEHETALEVGWLLAELEQRFGYGLDELARRFDRSVSWVSRRLALVEALPEAIQQQVREGKVLAQVAMKFLVPVARQSLEDCQRMAAVFAQHHCDTRQSGQLYAAWRQGSPAIRKRILDAPELFFKTQRQEGKPSSSTAAAELLRDLEMVAAIVNRTHRRLAGAAAMELDRQQGEAARQQIARIEKQLQRIDEKLLPSKNRMLSQAQRTTILELNAQQVGKREIARVLGISRVAVRQVLRSNSTTVPELQRPEKAEPHRQQILELFDKCKGNLVRVHEELVASGGAELSYAALTAFCRRHGIGYAPPAPAGQYDFAPGEEMQHDTSPHDLELGGKKRRVQTASAVLCYSRMLFFQCYPTFRRFDCKVFLTEALRYMGGATARVMIDNTHVVVLRGSGREMVPVPEMAAFGERFGFQFVAHAIGNANRSARVERPFWFIETNFLAGRTFSSWEDLNRRAREWCDKVNSTYKKHIRAVPRELFAVERLHLKPLPAWIPEVYRLQQRLVDIEGYVALNSNRYSVPVDWIGRRVEVRETKDKIEIQLDARRLVTHRRIAEAEHQRVMLVEHRPPRGQRDARPDPHPEEKAIVAAAPELADYVVGLKQRSRKVITLALRQLLRLVREYPREPLLGAVREAGRYGLYDLDRLERMILRRVTREYFLLDGELEDD
jgi:ParB/RepB/Spo0J family partition protein